MHFALCSHKPPILIQTEEKKVIKFISNQIMPRSATLCGHTTVASTPSMPECEEQSFYIHSMTWPTLKRNN